MKVLRNLWSSVDHGLNVIRNCGVCVRSDVSVLDVEDLKVMGNFWPSVVDGLNVIRNYDVGGWDVDVQVF